MARDERAEAACESMDVWGRNRFHEMLDAGKSAQEIAVELDRTTLAIYSRLQRSYRKRPIRNITRAVGLRAK
jgi:hypothetical protein